MLLTIIGVMSLWRRQRILRSHFSCWRRFPFFLVHGQDNRRVAFLSSETQGNTMQGRSICSFFPSFLPLPLLSTIHTNTNTLIHTHHPLTHTHIIHSHIYTQHMQSFTSASADRKAQCYNLRHQDFYRHDLSAPSIRGIRIGPTPLTLEWVRCLPPSLDFLDWDMGDEPLVDETVLMELLSTRPFLRRLSLRFRGNSRAIVPILAKCIGTCRYLEHLDLRNNQITDEAVLYLVRGLLTSSVRTVNLGLNQIGNHGARAFARLLAHRDCLLSCLDLNCNRIGNYGAHELTVALRNNTTLQTLVLYGNSLLSCGESFRECLLVNSTLEWCNLQRTTVTAEWVGTVEYYLTLNRCGRKILKVADQQNLPVGIWPIFLDRVSRKSGDAMYYFCLQKPELFGRVVESTQ